MLTAAQIKRYEKDGFLVLRNHFSEDEMARLDAAQQRNPPLDGNDGGSKFPEPGRYTLAKSCLKDPDFAYFAEHKAIVNGARDLLDDEVHLTAFVLYDRTPGGGGLPPHNDYKRWRPVGSSMNWLFTIVPMTDFNADTGELFVAPGSHRLERVCDRQEGVLHIKEAIIPSKDDFIDPGLKRGDLLFMNMHLWHRANANKSDMHRLGLFNKYAAAQFPPATGYYLFDDEAYDALSAEGKSIIAVHSNKPIASTRLLLQRTLKGSREYFFVNHGEELVLPGGTTRMEQAIPDWDTGNYIASLQQAVRDQIRIEVPWVSYIGDYEEDNHLCRIYGYVMNNNGFPVAYKEGRWVREAELSAAQFQYDYEMNVIAQWNDESKVRGKGLSQAQSRIDQYAY